MRGTALAKLLILHDEARQVAALCDALKQEGYATKEFTSSDEALKALHKHEFDLVLTDLLTPETDGSAFLRAALEIDKSLVGIVMTGQDTVEPAVHAMKMGALDYLLKPVKRSDVLPVISRALTVRRLRTENIQLLETVAIYKVSTAIALESNFDTMLQRIADAAFEHGEARELSVLLPTADGKELYVAAARGLNSSTAERTRVPLSDAVSSWVKQIQELPPSQEPADVQNLPGFPQLADEVSIPMLAGARLQGILSFKIVRNRSFAAGRLKNLNILAGTAAAALQAAASNVEAKSAEQRQTADNVPDAVFRYELLPERRYTYVSPAVTGMSGYSPADFYADPDLGFKLIHPEDRPLLEAAFRGEPQSGTTTLRWVQSNRKVTWIEQRHVFLHDDKGRLVAVEGIARDITQRRSLEEQVRQSQRMEAIGRLAGGVAHDFNNLLTVIIGYSDLMLEMRVADAMRDIIQEVRKAGKKAAVLTGQLLAFGRKQLMQPRVINFNEVVESHLKMLGRVIGEDIEIVTVLDPHVGNIKADTGQLEQILMNLAVNSRDAMPQGGRLTIESSSVMLDDTYAYEHFDVHPGPHVLLAVSDTGNGMDAATRSRIFEPFFTTKELGRGTGLGLSIVYGIVKQSGGNIWVYSEPGKGTTFKVYLPCTEEPEAVVQVVKVQRNPSGSESILVVEDEAVLRQLICAILRNAGYKILEAKSGHDAFEIFQQQKDEIGLVLTDLVLPGISGTELVGRLTQLSPGSKVLYMSGYSDEVIVRHGYLDPGMPFIQKPFGSGDLLRTVRKALDRV